MPKLNSTLNDLLQAVRQNNIVSVKKIMQQKTKPKERASFPFSCLFDSRESQYKEDIQRLILEATSLEDPTILSYFIKHGADVNFSSKFVPGGATPDCKTTPLHVAVNRRSHDLMEVLIGANANVNQPDIQGRSPLHHACRNCDVIATRLLVSSGANTHLVDSMGTTPLQAASRFGHVDLVRALLEHNAQIFQDKQRGVSPLHIAAQEGHVPLLDLFGSLVDVDVQSEFTHSPDHQPQRQSSAIHLACDRGLLETVRFIVERFGANVNITDSLGNTPLHRLVSYKYNFKTMRRKEDYSALADYLIKKKTKGVNLKNSHGNTPLHLASLNGFHRCAESLLMSGADPLIQNEAGLTSRDLIPEYDAAMKQTFLRCAPFSNAYVALGKVVAGGDNGYRSQKEAHVNGGMENLLLSGSPTETHGVQVYKTVVQTVCDI